MRILVVYPRLPVPAVSGNTIRAMALIKGLAQYDEIDLITFHEDHISEHHLDELHQYFQDVYLVHWKEEPRLYQVIKLLKKIIQGEPFFTKYVDSDNLKTQIHELTEKKNYDIVIIEHSRMSYYIQNIDPQLNVKTVLVLHNIMSVLYYRLYVHEKNLYKKLKLLLDWVPLRTWELKMARRFDKVVAMSEVDKAMLLKQRADLDVVVVPNGVDTRLFDFFSHADRVKNLLFVGSMDYEPNAEAMVYFSQRIWPAIRRQHPDCTLTIVGNAPPASIQPLDGRDGVVVAGYVDDLRPYYKRARVAIAPLRSGGGTRLKILEAMAFGTPVVSTRIGCEGLEVEDQVHLSLADDPVDFANRVSELLTDPSFGRRLARNGRALVESTYDWEAISQQYRHMLQNLVAS